MLKKIVFSALFVVFTILTVSSIQGGIVRVSFFPQIAGDQVAINLNMPNGTNEKVTDSIISFIEEKAIEVTKEINDEYFEKNSEKYIIR